MLTLRKCNRFNKIKNRYIITMGYKSKKINKRRYFKRQSRKLIKRGIYGGDSPKLSDNNTIEKQEKEIDLNNEKKDEIAADNIMKKIEEQNKIEIPSLEEIPVVGPVLEKTGDLVEGAAVKGLDMLGDSIGVDINNPESIGEKLDDIKDAVSSPENIEKTKEILANAGKYIEVGIDAASPVIEKTADKILPVVRKEMDKAVEAGLGTVVNLAEDVAGPLIGIPRTLISAAEAFNASVNAGSELVKGTAEAIQGTQENFNRIMDESMSKIPTMPTVPKIPTVPKVPNEMPNIKNNMSYPVQQGGRLLKKYKSEGKMIGGRTLQSQLEFLDSPVNSSQILKQYGGKWTTKSRRSLNRKMKSRRR